jgi:hypothetical protein
MITKGHWIGSYKFNNPAYQNMVGFEQTNFEIDIQDVYQEHFTGTVRDDLSTGGTEGVGKITGKADGEKIEFIKQMPVWTLIDQKGTRKTYNKKHPKIYYSGIFSQDKKTISGQWKFKLGFHWIGILPIPIIPVKGTWVMMLTG